MKEPRGLHFKSSVLDTGASSQDAWLPPGGPRCVKALRPVQAGGNRQLERWGFRAAASCSGGQVALQPCALEYQGLSDLCALARSHSVGSELSRRPRKELNHAPSTPWNWSQRRPSFTFRAGKGPLPTPWPPLPPLLTLLSREALLPVMIKCPCFYEK